MTLEQIQARIAEEKNRGPFLTDPFSYLEPIVKELLELRAQVAKLQRTKADNIMALFADQASSEEKP